MKKLIFISALLFTISGESATNEQPIRLSCECKYILGELGNRFPCMNAKKYSSVIINRKNGTMIFDGKESNIDWDDEYYYGLPYTSVFSNKTRWAVKLNRTTLWLSKKNKNIKYKPNGYSCKVVEGI